MRIITLDTETVSLSKPFVYDIGYVISDTETNERLLERSFVSEQIWHNLPLFETAYYANKRNLYISAMRGKNAVLKKFGYITQQIIRDIEYYEVESAYAYNSPFDDRAISFTCDYFKVINPFDDIPFYDIRGYVMNKIAFNPKYQAFCEMHELFTDGINYSTSAETVYRYLINDPLYIEEHTALADSKIELDILEYCIGEGAKWNQEYKIYQSIPRKILKTFNIHLNNQIVYSGQYTSLREYKIDGGKGGKDFKFKS